MNSPEHIATINKLKLFAEKKQFEFDYISSNDKVSDQIQGIESLIQKSPDYLIISPTGHFGLESVIQHARESGISIILIDNHTRVHDGSDVLAMIIPEHRDQGRLCAVSLAEYFNGSDSRILEIQGPISLSRTRDLSLGFRNELLDYSNLDFIAVNKGNSSRNDGYDAVRDALAQHGSAVSAVFAHSDIIGIGALDALLEANYSIPIVSVGGSEESAKAILATQYHSTVDSSGIDQSLFSVIEAHLKIRTVAPTVISNRLYRAQEALDLLP